jgi:large subunit ribosomal protein L18
MDHQKAKWLRRWKRHRRLRRLVRGTSGRPRLTVYRSLKHIYCQLIDDDRGKTLLAVSTVSPEIREHVGRGGNVESARLVGKALAQKALEQGITQAVFDRGGCKYHGRVAAVAESAREVGLKI